MRVNIIHLNIMRLKWIIHHRSTTWHHTLKKTIFLSYLRSAFHLNGVRIQFYRNIRNLLKCLCTRARTRARGTCIHRILSWYLQRSQPFEPKSRIRIWRLAHWNSNGCRKGACSRNRCLWQVRWENDRLVLRHSHIHNCRGFRPEKWRKNDVFSGLFEKTGALQETQARINTRFKLLCDTFWNVARLYCYNCYDNSSIIRRHNSSVSYTPYQNELQ